MKPPTTLLGAGLFTGMMAAGYHYNLTFVQIGLTDFGQRILEMDERRVALLMGLLALVAGLTAILTGWGMARLGWSSRFWIKLRLAFAVVLAQAILTLLTFLITTTASFTAWLLAAGLALGVGMPATFSLTVDLVPRRWRGLVAAAITALAYFAAEVFTTSWTFEAYRVQALLVLVPGVLGMSGLAFIRLPFMEALAEQHTLPAFRRGRFVQRRPDGSFYLRRSLVLLLVLMFAIFFIDSLGFLRLLETPRLMLNAWQSPETGVRTTIAVAHVLAALVAGVLYDSTGERSLFLWIFAIFALTHLMYSFHLRTNPGGIPALSMPMLYAIAVSLYTVVNFAIWADISTPENISLHTALGVALSGWTATFLSTAIAIGWRTVEMPLELHLRIVDALAFLALLGAAALIYFTPAPPPQRPPTPERP